MISNSDFEKLWMLYKTEGEPKGVSINAFCVSRGVNYREFNKWYYKMHKAIVPLEIEDAPVSETHVTVEPSDEENNQEIERAIDEIIRYDFQNIYRKVKRSDNNGIDSKEIT